MFSQFLLPHRFNFYRLFVVDVLHEIEIGIFKQIFTHLVWILYTRGASVVARLDRQYLLNPFSIVSVITFDVAISFRKVSSFGRSTIRNFSNNISEMKKFTARDFEDVLQCAEPCFEGLFLKSVDSKIQDLLFVMACWHASAKLWLHTEKTLHVFHGMTATFTKEIQHFANKICPQFDMIETPSEFATNLHAEATRIKKGTCSTTQGAKWKTKSFNIDTSKFHSITHYPDTIAMYDTTDSYSTQMVCHSIATGYFSANMDTILGRTRTSACEEVLRKDQ